MHQRPLLREVMGRQTARFAVLLALTISSSAGSFAQTTTLDVAIGIGGSGLDLAHEAVTDASGNVYVTGSFTGSVDFDPGAGSSVLTGPASGDAAFVASYDATGNYRWAFALGSGGTPNVGTAIALDAVGNLVVSGTYADAADFNPGAGTATLSGGGLFVAKYSSSGAYLWAFGVTTGVSGDTDIRFDHVIDGAGDIVVAGAFFGSADFDPGAGRTTLSSTKGTQSRDLFVAKYTSAGRFVWAFKLGSTGAKWINGVAVDDARNIAVTGWFTGSLDFDPSKTSRLLSSAGSADAFVAKYSPTAQHVWSIAFGGTSSVGDGGWSLACAANGDIVVGGGFSSTVDFDPGAGTASLTAASATANTGFLARYTAAGAYRSAFSIAGPSQVRALDIAPDGDIVITGTCVANASDFDPGTGVAILPESGAFVATYGDDGSFVDVFGIPVTTTPGGPAPRSIEATAGGLLIAGRQRGNPDFDPSAGVTTLPSTDGSYDAFVAWYANGSSLPRPVRNGLVASLPCVPAYFAGSLELSCDATGEATRVELIDPRGRTVESVMSGGAGPIALGASAPAGVYFVRLVTSDAARVVRVVKAR